MGHMEAALIERGKHDEGQRREALRAAATAVFAAKGYECATTREVAERAACSEGLIHRYFGGKRGLLLDVLRGRSEAAVPLLLGGVATSEDVGAELAALLLWWLDYAWEQRDFMRVCVAQSVVDTEVGRFIGGELNQQRVVQISERLKRHQSAGRVRADIDVRAVAEGISGYMFAAGFFGQVVFQEEREELRRRAVEMAAVIARGIATPGPSERPCG
ncbi:MAG TPA: TetR/AcrR family transcriptional regulator [Dehalococcoidia bacterium]|nr:TetR/AcrR family transcriptional regulator [Dehalococcoidia bacterium]